jgi:hypothetical protein
MLENVQALMNLIGGAAADERVESGDRPAPKVEKQEKIFSGKVLNTLKKRSLPTAEPKALGAKSQTHGADFFDA